MTKRDLDRKITDKLRGYNEEPPQELFSRIEESLARAEQAAGLGAKRSGRLSKLLRYGAVAAILLGVVLTALYLGREVNEESRMANEIPASTTSPVIRTETENEPTASNRQPAINEPVQELRLLAVESVAPIIRNADKAGRNSTPIVMSASDESAHTGSDKSNASSQQILTDNEYAGIVLLRDDTTSQAGSNLGNQRGNTASQAGSHTENSATGQGDSGYSTRAANTGDDQARPNNTGSSAASTLRQRTDAYWNQLIAQDSRNNRKARGGKVSAALYAGNFGTGKGDMRSNDPDKAAASGMLINQSTDNNKSPSSEICGEDGKPILVPTAPNIQSLELQHKMPLNVGLSLALPLTDELSLISGVNYSYLHSSSSQSFLSESGGITRELHYIGIPLGISYTFYRNKHLSIYAQGNGMIEKAVSWRETYHFANSRDNGTEVSERSVKGVQLSVNAAAGISYDFNKHVGLYLEPGISYYFDNKHQPASYRTIHPTSFSLRVGIRVGI